MSSAMRMPPLHAVGLAIVGLCIGSVHTRSTADPSSAAEVRVNYVQPEKFTDIGDRGYGVSPANLEAVLRELAQHIRERAGGRIEAGSTLTVTIKDIDRAGAFEWWHGAQGGDVRIVRDIYPPRIKLEFSLVDADGEQLAGGSRELSDPSFMATLEYRNDRLRYEKKLIDDWVHREFAGRAGRQPSGGAVAPTAPTGRLE